MGGIRRTLAVSTYDDGLGLPQELVGDSIFGTRSMMNAAVGGAIKRAAFQKDMY